MNNMLLYKIKERLTVLENTLKNFKEETRKDIEKNSLEITNTVIDIKA